MMNLGPETAIPGPECVRKVVETGADNAVISKGSVPSAGLRSQARTERQMYAPHEYTSDLARALAGLPPIDPFAAIFSRLDRIEAKVDDLSAVVASHGERLNTVSPLH